MAPLPTVVLHFDVGGETLSLDVAAVAEVTAATPLVRPPGITAGVAGVALLRARPLTVIDLGALLALPPAAGDGRACFLVLTEPWRHLAVGLVSEVGLATLAGSQGTQLAGHIKLSDGRSLRLLDPEALVLAIEQNLAGAAAGPEQQPWI